VCNSIVQQLDGDNDPVEVTNATLVAESPIALMQEFQNSNKVELEVAGRNSIDMRVRSAFSPGTADYNKWKIIIKKTWHQLELNGGMHFTGVLYKKQDIGTKYDLVTTVHQYSRLNNNRTKFVCTHGVNPMSAVSC